MMQRSYIQTIIGRINEPRKFIQVIMGPRQVGKTTLITQALEVVKMPFLFETADNVVGDGSTWFKMLWNRARMECRSTNATEYLLVVDEVQKIHNWSEVVKREWDMDTFNAVPIKLVLLGSSSLLIQKGLTESLTGRFEVISIPHWSFTEMRQAFGWTADQYIWFGGYPGPVSLVDDEPRWKQYIRTTMIETSITKDVLMMTRVDKPALMHKLFDIGCRYSAQIVSLTKIQGEMNEKGNLTTLGNYLSLLNSANLLGGLEKYSQDVIRQRASKPKFQVYNNALMSAQLDISLGQAKADGNLWGRLVESAIGCHLLTFSAAGEYKMYYWNENSREVDYVLTKGGETIGIEVKSGNKSYNGGMADFDARFHPKALYTVGTDGIPIEEFLSISPESLF